jgi:hypothetical protein
MSTKVIDGGADFVARSSENKGLVARVATYFEALREGLEMANRYKDLTERGVPAAAAAQAAVKAVEARH